MTEEQFWQIFQRSYDKCGGDIDEQTETLAEELEALPSEEIQAFDRIFDLQWRRTYSWDLWGAAYIMNGGCSDDGFCYFRNWLISRGKEWFMKALIDPDSLADYPDLSLERNGVQFEEIAYVAGRIYEEREGELPFHPPVPVEGPKGIEWEEDDATGLQRRWPNLFEKHWDNPV